MTNANSKPLLGHTDSQLFNLICSHFSNSPGPYRAQMFETLASMTTLRLEPEVKDILGNVSNVLSDAFSSEGEGGSVIQALGVAKSMQESVNKLVNGQIVPPVLTHSISVSSDLKRAVLWGLLAVLYLSYMKYPNEKGIKVLFFALLAFILYSEHETIKTYMYKLLSYRAQSSELLDLVIEGTSIFLFGRNVTAKSGDYFQMMDSLGKINNISEGFTKYVTRVVTWVESLVHYVSNLFGFQLRSGNQYELQVESIDIRLQVLEDLLKEDRPFSHINCQSAEELNLEINNLQQRIARVRHPRSPQDLAIYGLISRMQPVLRLARQYGGYQGQRNEPWSLHLVGNAGVGKDAYMSSCLERILTFSILTEAEKEDYRLNPDLYAVYTKAALDRFWSGLRNGKKSFYFPDIFQNTTVEGDKDTEAQEIIHVLSCEKFPANQAALEDKGRVFVAPEIVLLTSNCAGSTTAKFPEIRHLDALYRRLDNTFIMFPADGYGIDMANSTFHTSSSDPRYKRKLNRVLAQDHARERNLPATHAYRFQKYNMVTGTPEGPILTEPEFRHAMVEDLARHRRLNAERENMFAEILREEIFGAQTANDDDDTKLYFDTVARDPTTDEAIHEISIGLLSLGDDKKKLSFDQIGMYLDAILLKNPLLQKLKNYLQYGFNYITSKFTWTQFRYFVDMNLCSIWTFLFSKDSLYLNAKSALHELAEDALLGVSKFRRSMKTYYDNVPDYYWSVIYNSALTVVGGVVTIGLFSLVKTLLSLYTCIEEGFVAQAFPDLTQDDKSMNKVVRNQLYVEWEFISPCGKRAVHNSNYILMLKDRTCLTVYHSIKSFKELYPDAKKFLLLYRSSNLLREKPCFRIDFDEIDIKHIKHADDLVLMKLPLTMMQFPDITDRFPSNKDKDLLAAIKAYSDKCTYRYAHDGSHQTNTDFSQIRSNRMYLAGGPKRNAFTGEMVVMPEYKVTLPECLVTQVSFPGACGLPIFIKVIHRSTPYANQPMICYLHVAGTTTGTGMGIPLYKEMFDNLVSKEPFLNKNESLMEHYTLYENTLSKKGLLIPNTKPIETIDFDSGITGQEVIAERNHITQARDSQLVRSPFFGDVELQKLLPNSPDQRPAVLKYVRAPDGKSFISAIEHNFTPYGNNVSGVLSDHKYFLAANREATNFIKAAGDYSLFDASDFDVLYDKVVMGSYVENDPSKTFKCLSRSKSAGYTLKETMGVQSRAEIFGDGILPSLDTEQAKALKEITRQLWNKLLAGEEICVIVKAVAKDELKPKEKVLEGKTRLFANADTAVLIIQRMLLHDVIYCGKYNRRYNRMLVGISPGSTEWGKLYYSLTSLSRRVACLDHSGFDTSRTARDFEAFKRFIDRFYFKDRPEIRLARQTLLNSMFNYISVISTGRSEKYINLNSALCSGYLFTSLLGCFINLVSTSIGFVSASVMTELETDNPACVNNITDEEFLSHLLRAEEDTKLYVYGDDSIYSTTKENIYSVERVGRAMQELLGCRVTNESDNGDENGFVDISEGVIISRQFKPLMIEGEVFIAAPLLDKSLHKMIFWDKKDVPLDSLKQKIDNFLKEMSLHGEERHAQAVAAIHDKALTKLNHVSDYESYYIAIKATVIDEYEAYDGDEYVAPRL